MYPFYEEISKSGITTVCIHKGLLPADYEKSWPDVWQYNTVWDMGQAAKDWPQINFVIYHSALRPFLEAPEAALAEFASLTHLSRPRTMPGHEHQVSNRDHAGAVAGGTQ